MNRIFSEYSRINKNILYLLVAEFFLQLINMSLLQILLIYMEKTGYADYQSAGFISYRFLGVLLFSVPLGLFIKERKIFPLFYISAIGTPLLTFFMIYCTLHHLDLFLRVSQFLWGVSFICMQVSILPFILRNSPAEHHTEAITLSYGTGSLAGICSGALIFLFENSWPRIFDERIILQIIAGLGLVSLFFIHRARFDEFVPQEKERSGIRDFDWNLIIKALVPTTIIAVGAGLTIPFIGLFFFKIHGLDSDEFAVLNSATTFFVFLMILMVPKLKYRYGYKISITLSQALAIIALIFLATTEWYALKASAIIVAIACYALRQPLMNMAAPMTSDMTMKYVGKRNREMMSALNAAIWSGSWFISSHIFRVLREENVSYANVFLTTAALYSLGVLWYYFLILDFNRREKLGLNEKDSMG